MAKKRSKDYFEFHLKNIKDLKKDVDFLRKINNFNMENCYTREDEKGWWMATKQILIRKYINLYLTVFGGQKNKKDLIFIDMLSSNGMNKVTKRNKRDNFIFPGSAISAALISQKKKLGFIKFYCNDIDSINREILTNRFNALNNSDLIEKKINYDIPKKNIDSNEWIKHIINEINENYRYKHCLIIIDNEGMDILFNAIRDIRQKLKFADLIINLQSQAIGRAIKSERINLFFGRKIPLGLKRGDILHLYRECLQDLGFNSEEIIVKGEKYFYYLFFCHRIEASGEWMRMIEDYRTKRFRDWHDKNVKEFWDIVSKKITPLDKFWNA
ncbi:MAG: hypothetical protein ACTSQJ_20140 [Promethearchaeota archaeon]